METRVLPAVKVTVSSTLALWNAAKPIEATLLGMIIEFRTDTSPTVVSGANAASPIDVTVLGIVAVPAQFVLPVTTLSVIVKVPPELQLTATLASALTIVRPFHVVASPKPVAAEPMFTTGSVPTELKAA
jgi:hypothetical protein